MKNKILIGLGVIAAVIVLLKVLQKPHVIDVSGEYIRWNGRRFKTEKDFIVFQYSDSKDLFLREPDSQTPKIEELPKKLPYVWYGMKIYGVLPKGSEFKIVGAKRSTSETMGHDWRMVEIESVGEFKGKIVGTDALEFYKDGKIYAPQYAVELSSVGK